MLHPALAYVDPGSGSLIMQMVIAGVLGALGFLAAGLASVRNAIGRFFGMFRRSKPRDSDRPAE